MLEIRSVAVCYVTNERCEVRALDLQRIPGLRNDETGWMTVKELRTTKAAFTASFGRGYTIQSKVTA
jgi:hypothetical protein